MAGPQPAAAALARVTHNRWALPVLAYMAQAGGSKFVTLSRRLGASPASVKRALVRLGELDLVVRNPGRGHPMRPEYVLGATGERTARLAAELMAWSEAEQPGGQLLKKWQLPVLVAADPQARFGWVRGQLPSATARAVAMALKAHANSGLIDRAVDPGYPPVPLYTPTARAGPGRAQARRLGELLAAA